jgi:hypothetical protein
MKVHVDAPYGLSRAMTRVAKALAAHAPASVQVVQRAADADLVLLHTVGYDDTVAAVERLQAAGQRYAVAQYCLRSTQQRHTQAWQRLWAGADLVWSYYDLAAACEADGCEMDPAVNFYMSPLGVDAAFAAGPLPRGERPIDVMTSGYVSTGQEAIWEFALAAERTGRTVKHLGPHTVQGMPRRPRGWSAMLGVTDDDLAAFLGCTKWVSGLRYGEGFEMPCIEGLARGARPVVFDRPDMRQWYDGHAVFVPEVPSEELACILEDVLTGAPEPVSEAERAAVLRRFAWPEIAAGFWQALAEKKEAVA